MRIVAIVEARMRSRRLPGKVMLPAAGKPMLQRLFERLMRCETLNEIVLATGDDPANDVLSALAEWCGVYCHVGSETDVLGRVVDAARARHADVIVKVTGDCPIIDPQIVDRAVRLYGERRCDYVTNGVVRTYPDGMDVDVIRTGALERSAGMPSVTIADREHVVTHLRRHPVFSGVNLIAPRHQTWPELGLTLDEPADYELLRRIFEYFGDSNFGLDGVLDCLREVHPEWLELNANVKRNAVARTVGCWND